MLLEKILTKIHSVEGLAIAIQILLDNYIEVTHSSLEEFNSVSALIRLLKSKIIEIRHDIAKRV